LNAKPPLITNIRGASDIGKGTSMRGDEKEGEKESLQGG